MHEKWHTLRAVCASEHCWLCHCAPRCCHFTAPNIDPLVDSVLKNIERLKTAASLEPSTSFIVSEDTLLSLCLSTPVSTFQYFSGFYSDSEHGDGMKATLFSHDYSFSLFEKE
jgi:hypothetical protein